jgi:hypothetical protein
VTRCDLKKSDQTFSQKLPNIQPWRGFFLFKIFFSNLADFIKSNVIIGISSEYLIPKNSGHTAINVGSSDPACSCI